MKLFQDWFTSWNESERTRLLEQFREEDPDFMAQYDKAIRGEEASQSDATPTQSECEEGQNPPSSVSSPPSTLPRSHSPHDSGLDEPPSDSDHTEPHSLDSSHDVEAVASSGSPAVSETQSPPQAQHTSQTSQSPPSTDKSASSLTNPSSTQQDETPKSDKVTNGVAEPSKNSKEGAGTKQE